jgi:acetylglutamate kinase
MGDSVAQQFASDVAHLQQKGVKAIVVHDGGPQIDAELSRQGITPRFSNGLRITDASTMSVVESVLKNDINKSKVESIEEAGGRAVGLCAHHRNMVTATRLRHSDALDYGSVGVPDQVKIDF